MKMPTVAAGAVDCQRTKVSEGFCFSCELTILNFAREVFSMLISFLFSQSLIPMSYYISKVAKDNWQSIDHILGNNIFGGSRRCGRLSSLGDKGPYLGSLPWKGDYQLLFTQIRNNHRKINFIPFPTCSPSCRQRSKHTTELFQSKHI